VATLCLIKLIPYPERYTSAPRNRVSVQANRAFYIELRYSTLALQSGRSHFLSTTMIRRMADKLHIGHSKPTSDLYNGQLINHSTSLDNPSVTLSSVLDKRGSVSTQRTSASDIMEGISSAEPSTPLMRSQLRVTRAKGTYCLADFIIKRTLGTGSFGRVHLGNPL
jgi:hypothetical protein